MSAIFPMKSHVLRLILGAGLFAGAVSASAHLTADEQRALTPQAAFDRLLSGHERFLAGTPEHGDLRASVRATAAAQHPAAIVITCIDSRTPAELIFGQGIGDIFCGRIAGNFVDAVMLGSIEFATKVAGAPLIVVLGHSECGAIKGACDDVRLGHLTATLAALRPAIDAVPDDGTPRNGANVAFVRRVTAANVQVTVERIRRESPGLADLIAAGKVGIVGGVYELATGRIDWVTATAMNVRIPAS